ncbi:WD40 repeat domain-containing protein [Limnoglobus roseus]|uniref:WD40 repeat domain-containing protein n=1 Tax=Limnoglobus roseus TaxID=2598579 RepID=A0A5C1AQB1_9BACT|nr:WD40 repeat domain-containing protein [Limnoglobus roseus]
MGFAFAAVLLAATGLSIAFGLSAQRAGREADERREDADHSAQLARDAGQAAGRERDAARAAHADLRRSLYASSMSLAQAAWDNDNLPRLIELLEEQRPKTGEEDLRNFEWRYWDRLAHAARRTWTFHAHVGTVGAALSGDASRVGYWGYEDNGDQKAFRVRVKDTATGRELFDVSIPRNGAPGFVQDGRLALSRDGRRLLFSYRSREVASHACQVLVYDVDGGRMLFNREGIFEQKTALSSDGSLVAVLSHPKKFSFQNPNSGWDKLNVWDVSNPDRPAVVIENDAAGSELANAPSFSANGTRIAAIARTSRAGVVSSTIRVWNATTGQSEVNNPMVGEEVVGIAFTPDTQRLATVGMKSPGSGSKDTPPTYLTIWRLTADGRFTAQHSTPISHVVSSVPAIRFAFTADGRRLALTNGFQPALVLDVENGVNLRAVKSTTGIVAAAFTADGARLLTTRNVTGNQPASVVDGTIQEWDAAPPAAARRRDLWSLVWNPARTRQASFDQARSVDFETGQLVGNSTVYVKDAAGKEVVAFRKHTVPVRDLTFSPDGRWAFSVSDEEAILWRPETGEVGWKCKATGSTRFVNGQEGGEFSPDGRWIALRNADDTRVVTAGDLKEKFRTGPVVHARFSPDGRRAVTFHRGPLGADDKAIAGEVKVWDVEAGKLVETTPWPEGVAWPTVFTADGRSFAVAGRTAIVLFDTATGVKRVALRPEADLGRVVFSPDGTRLVMVRRDGFTRFGDGTGAAPIAVWDTATGVPVCHLKGHASPIRDMVFSPDGRRIATLGSPRTTRFGEPRVWDAATGRELLTLPEPVGAATGGRLAFSPDGARLEFHPSKSFASDGSVTIWDATPRPEPKAP